MIVTLNKIYKYKIMYIVLYILAMHSLAASSRPRLSETAPKWFMFETSCYAFGGRIRRFAELNLNKVNIVLLYRIYTICKLFLSI